MAIKLGKANNYEKKQYSGIGANSLDLSDTNFVVKANGVVSLSTIGGVIDGVNDTITTYASDNQTGDVKEVNFTPTECNFTYKVDGAGQEIVFASDLVTSNTVDLDINGVAMTTETFATDNATTLTNIASQIETDFSTTVLSATSDGTDTITVVPKGLNSTVVITDVTVAAGATQTTATVSDLTIAVTDEDNFYDLATSNVVDLSTKSTTTGQVQLIEKVSDSVGEYKIVNL